MLNPVTTRYTYVIRAINLPKCVKLTLTTRSIKVDSEEGDSYGSSGKYGNVICPNPDGSNT